MLHINVQNKNLNKQNLEKAILGRDDRWHICAIFTSLMHKIKIFGGLLTKYSIVQKMQFFV